MWRLRNNWWLKICKCNNCIRLLLGKLNFWKLNNKNSLFCLYEYEYEVWTKSYLELKFNQLIVKFLFTNKRYGIVLKGIYPMLKKITILR